MQFITLKLRAAKLFIYCPPGWCIFLTLFFYACQEKRNDALHFSAGFKPIYDSTTRLFELNKVDEGLHYLDSSAHYLSGMNVADKFRFYNFHYVINNKIKHDNEKALLYADSMLVTVQSAAASNVSISTFAEADFAKGDALFELGRYSESYTYYYQGYLIGTNYDKCTLSDYTYRMGMISYKQGNFQVAANYFRASFKQNQSCKDEFVSFFRQQEVLDNTALSYRNCGKNDSAMIFFNQALKYLNNNSAHYHARSDIIEVARAVIYGNMAGVLTSQGHINEAATLLEKSISTNLRKGNDNHDAELSEVKLGAIYLKTFKKSELQRLLADLHRQLDTVKNAEAEAGWNSLMAEIYKQKKDFLGAIRYGDRYHRIKDSLAEKNKALKETNINEHFTNIDKQSKILSLQNAQQVYLYTGIIFLSMLFIIVLLMRRNWSRSRQEMTIVSALNKQVILQKADLERTLADLKQSSQEKDTILRTVAHDLRNPLGGIASLTATMVEDTGFTIEQMDLLRVIKETANDSLELINEILEAASNTPAELLKQSVDINMLVINSVELLRFKAAEKNQKIALHTFESPVEVMISREKIWRVISNLISNSIKFSPVGASIDVTLTEDENDVQIAFKDNGIGIPTEIQGQVFNMFTNAKRPGTLGEKSFGLGLSICRQIIEKHNGKIWFESDAATGTTFYIRLSKTVVHNIARILAAV